MPPLPATWFGNLGLRQSKLPMGGFSTPLRPTYCCTAILGPRFRRTTARSANPNAGVLPNLTQPSSPQASPAQGGSGATVPFQGDDSGLILTSPILSHADTAGGGMSSPTPDQPGAM